MSEPLIKPTVHLNGSSRDALCEALEQARAALRSAIVALEECSPHARDYYPQGDTAFHRAVAQHKRRMLALKSVDLELTDIHESVVDG
jgi:hypothetical protein